MKKIRRVLAIVVIASLSLSVSAFANNTVWERFMRNNFDVIAIGEIIGISKSGYEIYVDGTIVSARGDREQLHPEAMQLVLVDPGQIYVGNGNVICQAGDYVLAAAVKKKNADYYEGYMYKVDGLDKASLKLDIHDRASASFLLEVAMIEDFIHSDGQNTEFGTRVSSDGKTMQALRYKDKSHRDAEVIFEVDNR
ncbi:MAG: hypothetical protein VB065_07750 [Eubacteriales bacterium]|nr:hypothetical protein [Christensenellaceae bacterium]MEA5065932.1 hypothetical protein [Eubacteriales bacterium]